MLKHANAYLDRTAESGQRCLKQALRANVLHGRTSPIKFSPHRATPQACWMMWIQSALILFLMLHAGISTAQTSLSDVVGIPPDAAIYPIPGVGFVNLINGNLHVEIPLRTITGRNGKKSTAVIVYDNSFWESLPCPNQTCNAPNGWATQQAPFPGGGGYGGPVNIYATEVGQVTASNQTALCGSADQTTYSSFIYTDPHGTVHPFPAAVVVTSSNSECYPSAAQVAATDGSGYWLDVTNGTGWVVYDMHGNVVTNNGPDTNGNVASRVSQNELGQSLYLPTGSTGFSIGLGTVHVWTNFNDPSIAEQQGSASVISSITLPGGRSYAFQYDDAGSTPKIGHYGTLMGITLPTGGQITITSTPQGVGAFPMPAMVVSSVQTPDGTWNFQYNTSTQTVTAIAPPDPLTGISAQTTGTKSGSIETVKYYSGPATGAPLRTVQTTFVKNGVSSVTTTLEDGKSSSIQYGYEDQCTARVNLKQEFDFNGSLIRAAKIQYLTTANDDALLCTQFNGAPAWDPSDPYLGTNNSLLLHIIDIPQSITVYGAGGVGSTPVAQTNFTYDSTALTATSGSAGTPVVGLAGHDDPDFGMSMTHRGNPTVISQMTSPGNFITTTNIYNILGELVSTTDGNGNQTQADYSDSWNDASCISSPVFAYLTTVTNALGQDTKNTYNSCDGTLASIKDQNDINAGRNGTVYIYDGLQRVTNVALPDLGNTQVNYGGSSVPEIITTTVSADPDPARVSTQTLDVLGRASTVVTPSGSSVQTTYDSRGRLFTVTNPSNGPSGITTHYYDALNRPTVLVQSDGVSKLQWCYEGLSASNQTNCLANKSSVSGSWIDYSDETSRHWQQVGDGLGRLTSVMEPSSGNSQVPAIETDYQYSPLNDLTGVTQNGVSGETAVARTFSYDGMSRLLSAANAESGTTSYQYDSNGNVLNRVDARGTTAGGVWYCYDGLNRLTGKSYTQQACPMSAPAVKYGYDSSSISGTQNPVGRLTSETVMNGSTILAQRQPYWHDPMGRIKAELQCTPGNCSGTPYTLSYVYDLAGSTNSSSNGVAGSPIQLSYQYDAGGRLDLVSSSLNGDANHPATLFAASATGSGCGGPSLTAYNGADQLQVAQMGVTAQQTALSITRCYDNRLRVVSETDQGQDSTPGVAASTTVTISGSENSIAGSGTAAQATGTISLSYSGALVIGARPLYASNSITLPDGYHVSFIATANSAITVANAIAAVLNTVSSPVTAVVSSGGTASAASLVLTTKATGSRQNGAISLSLVTTKVTAAPASLSGGAGTTYDTGTVTANINGTAVSTAYGQSSTPQTLATALAAAISGAGAGVTANAGTGAAITVIASQAGTADNGISVNLSSATDESKFFSSASFSGTSGTLSGGIAGTTIPATIYSYTIAGSNGASGYDANGNLLSYNDGNTGGWALTYDNVNRISTGIASSGVWTNLNLGWTYDSFGNRKTQTPTGSPNAPVPPAQTLDYLPGHNQISNYQTDAAGNVTYDLIHNYLYDAEGRVCAISYYSGGVSAYMQYIYDAEGRRVAKGSINSFTCNPASNGFALTDQYILGLSGESISELDGSGNMKDSNVYAGGRLLATYSNNSTYFALNDWLGSKRVVANPNGTVAEACMNLPFGDELICSAPDPSAHHFTGQLRDQESGNDYFAARYYENATGRFMSPDYWGDDDGPPGPLPYGDLNDPQSLNLYGYVRNNALSRTDSDGHDCIYNNGDGTGYVQRGDCTSDTDSGVFINGTINVDSFNYNAANNSSSFSYTTESGGLGTGLLQGPDLNGGFDAGSLGAGVFGAGNVSTFNNAFGVVNAAGNAELAAAGFAFPLEHLGVTLLSGNSPSGLQQAAGGIRRKPGSLGEFGSTARENKIARDISKALGLGKDQEQAVHSLLQEGSQMLERPLTFKEGLEYVGKALGMIE